MDVEAFSRVGAVSDTVIDMMASSALWWMSDEPVTEMMRGESFVMVAMVNSCRNLGWGQLFRAYATSRYDFE